MRYLNRKPCDWQECCVEFLHEIWAPHGNASFFLGAKRSGRWQEQHFAGLPSADVLHAWFDCLPGHVSDLYFCPNAFARGTKRRKEHAHPTPYAWCDIDAADPAAFRPQPSILTETSPGRYQGLWWHDKKREPQYAEAVSKHLAYAHGGDPGGWSITKMLRLPFTFNLKPSYKKPVVRMLRWSRERLNKWPEAAPTELAIPNSSVWLLSATAESIIRKYSNKIESKYLSLMRHRRILSGDRSRCIFMIIVNLHKAGASPDEIATVLAVSPYFLSKHGENQYALQKEINRITAKIDIT